MSPGAPPPPGPAREVHFPPVHSTSLENGMQVDLVEYRTLPVLYLRLVVDTRAASLEERAAGLRRATARMLREGTARRTSEQIADAIEFVGGDMGVDVDHDACTLSYRVLREHADSALELMAEVAQTPSFPEEELAKYKRRELDRLAVAQTDPSWLGNRAFYKELYGQHPYSVTDVTPDAVQALGRESLADFHARTFTADGSLLIAVGDVDPARFTEMAERHFGAWRRGGGRSFSPPAPPAREKREIVLIDRPASVQSVITVGNLALRRADDGYIPLRVANQVLGATASSRLFLDLRERRSLTYGAYSRIEEMADISPFRAYASVRNDVTEEALRAFLENIERWRSEPATDQEMLNAKTYLTGVFPIFMETPGSIALMLATQRVLNLGRDYWSTYRGRIAAVTAEQALDAAKQYVHPDRALVVVVGRAASIEAALAKFGPVRRVRPVG